MTIADCFMHRAEPPDPVRVSAVKLVNNCTCRSNVHDNTYCQERRVAVRKFSIAALTVLGLVVGATLVNRPAASVPIAGGEFDQSSLAIDQLTTSSRNLPIQSFDAF